MKKITALLLALVLMLSMTIPAQAAYEYKLLYDATEKLDRDLCWELGANRLVELSDAYKTQVRVDVVTSVEEYTIEEYAEIFYESFGYGYAGTKDGILLMVLLTEDETGLTYSDHTVYCGGESKEKLDGILTIVDNHLSPWLVWEGDIAADNLTFQGLVTAFADCAEGFLSGELTPVVTVPPAPISKQGRYVTDDTDLLTGEEWEEINIDAIAASQKHNVGVYLAIVEDFAEDGSKTIQEAAQNRYQTKNLGRGVDKDGILLMISMAEGYYAIYPQGKCALLFGEQAVGELSDILLNEFDAGRPAQGLVKYLHHCDEILSGEVVYSEDILNPAPAEPEEGHNFFTPIVIVIAAILCFLILWDPKKKAAKKASDQ